MPDTPPSHADKTVPDRKAKPSGIGPGGAKGQVARLPIEPIHHSQASSPKEPREVSSTVVLNEKPSCLRLLIHFTLWPLSLAFESADSNRLERIAITAITTSSSISVNALRDLPPMETSRA